MTMTYPKSDLELIKKNNLGEFSNTILHDAASEYQGYEYSYKNKNYLQRTAKRTPKKNGQFVTLWRRGTENISEPYSSLDDYDFAVVICRNNKFIGRFLFPKSTLIEKGIFTNKLTNRDGKRGFRVYPPWVKTTSPQASVTQKWQITYFSKELKL